MNEAPQEIAAVASQSSGAEKGGRGHGPGPAGSVRCGSGCAAPPTPASAQQQQRLGLCGGSARRLLRGAQDPSNLARAWRSHGSSRLVGGRGKGQTCVQPALEWRRHVARSAA